MLDKFHLTRKFLLSASTAIGVLSLLSVFLSGPAAAAELRKDILVGAIGNFPPYFQIDSKGRPSGFAVDVTQAIARNLGLNVTFKTFKTEL